MPYFTLPDLGEGLQEAEVVGWHVKEGDTVKVDDPVSYTHLTLPTTPYV